MSVLTQLRQLTPKKRVLTLAEARSIAERQANRLRALTGHDTEPMLPTEAITNLPRLRIFLATTMSHSGMSGWDDDSKVWQIVINGQDAPTRQRFTLAHEYKHVIDATSHETTYRDIGGYSAHEQAEDVCDYFAGCLLVPKTLLKNLWADGTQDTTTLARIFGVSPAAMRVRLRQTGLIETRRHKWFFRDRPDQAEIIDVGSDMRALEVV
ncbi:MAG: ImmA/IrrE family metallo-endopeptidase [Actinomycetota bacterium]